MTTSTAIDPEIYNKSGNVDKHLEGVKKQYDTPEKLEFYSLVMGDGTANIHFGKWDNIDIEQEGAYGKASEQMTDYMYNLVTSLLPSSSKKEDGAAPLTYETASENMTDYMFGIAKNLLPHRIESNDFKYIDLGSGTGAAAIQLLQKHTNITEAACLNLCQEQNTRAKENATKVGVGERIHVETGTYEDVHMFQTNSFDFAFSQDAFVHAFSKQKAYSEALKIVKPGGAFIFCDLMCGNGDGVSDDELATFAQTNMVNDWLSPEENVKAAENAGWTDVTFVDLTPDIRVSFQLMLKKVDTLIMASKDDNVNIDEVLLTTYKENLSRRVTQVDRGVFKWGVIHAKKKA